MQPFRKVLHLIAIMALGLPAAAQTPPKPKPGLGRVGHIIVLFLENRSFDHLFGLFPGADGVANAGFAAIQVTAEGRQFMTLPAVINNRSLWAGTALGGTVIDTRFTPNLPNGPFRADRYVGLQERTGDLVHRFYQEQEQIDDGKMDKFVAMSGAGALPMGYFDARPLLLYSLATEYTLADRFFHAAFGGGFLNHFWLICACTPRFENAPPGLVAQLDQQGRLTRDGSVTPDGYVVNTIEPMAEPHDPKVPDRFRLPLQTMPTIGRLLTDAGVSWAWYSGGFADAVAGRPDPTFVSHHQPFVYFADYADDTPGRAEHLFDERDMIRAIRNRTLPAVSFYKPIGADDQHPAYADLVRGDLHAALIIDEIQKSFIWDDAVIIVTYAGNGGMWDHVAPPKTDRWGPGTSDYNIAIRQAAFHRSHHLRHHVDTQTD